MAELILTDEEKAAATWLELDDAALGKVVKKTAIRLVDFDKDEGRVFGMSAVMILVGQVDAVKGESSVTDIKGLTKNGGALGDWRVTVERVDGDKADG